MIWGIALFAVFALSAFAWVLVAHNSLVRLRQHTLEAWSQVDVELERRHGLVPNLVETVKGWAGHERETLERVAKARAAAAGGLPSRDRIRRECELGGAVEQLLVAAEAYPELSATRGFRALAGELAHTDDRIAAALRFYNANVRAYETRRQQFPESWVASAFGFGSIEYYRLSEPQARASGSLGRVA